MSEGKPAALVLAPEAPFPVTGGGQMRTASLLEYLAQSYTVDVIVFRESGAADPQRSFPPGLVRDVDVVGLPFHSKHGLARAARNLRRFMNGKPPLVDRFSGFHLALSHLLRRRRYELGLVEHFWCAGYADLLSEHCSRLVLDLHNIESVLLDRCARTESGAAALLFSGFARACRRLEERWLRRYDLLLVSSAEDRTQAASLAPGTRSLVYPNAIPLIPPPEAEKSEAIVFSGNLEYHPNRSAVDYFHTKIWPLLRDKRPNLVWRLIGKNESAVKRQLRGDPRIEVIGPVENAVQSLAACKIAIAPILSGSGTRVKIIEAWAACLPVVSTAIGAEGLPGRDGEHLLIANQVEDFAGAVSSILQSSELERRLGTNGRALYERELTWAAAWKHLEKSIIQAGVV